MCIHSKRLSIKFILARQLGDLVCGAANEQLYNRTTNCDFIQTMLTSYVISAHTHIELYYNLFSLTRCDSTNGQQPTTNNDIELFSPRQCDSMRRGRRFYRRSLFAIIFLNALVESNCFDGLAVECWMDIQKSFK